MSRGLKPFFILSVCAIVVACGGVTNVAEFWRPISEPNITLLADKAQRKLDFDLSQCRCGIYPLNIPTAELNSFEPDKQRLAETSVTMTPDGEANCIQRPSLVVQECMRSRGWEVTNCSGRMPLPGGGSLCAAYVPPEVVGK